MKVEIVQSKEKKAKEKCDIRLQISEDLSYRKRGRVILNSPQK